MNEIWDRQYHTFVLNTIEKNKNIKKQNKKELKKKGYKNPTDTNWGKIIILILTMAMALASVATLIYYIVVNVTRV